MSFTWNYTDDKSRKHKCPACEGSGVYCYENDTDPEQECGLCNRTGLVSKRVKVRYDKNYAAPRWTKPRTVKAINL